MHAAYALTDGLACVRLPLVANATSYPDLSAHFPAADRMQRAAFDLIGVRAEGAADGRPWLRHGAWPSDYFPLRRDSDGARTFDFPCCTTVKPSRISRNRAPDAANLLLRPVKQ